MPGKGGRVGIVGCVGGCVSYTQGDAEAQASIQAMVGMALMICTPKNEDTSKTCGEEEKQDCGMYDPNCDNDVTPSVSGAPGVKGRGGAGLGVSVNGDGSVCVLIGPFAGPPIPVTPTIELGGISE